MKIEDLVLSVKAMEIITKKYFKPQTGLCWDKDENGEYYVCPTKIAKSEDFIPTMTMQEIIDFLPLQIIKGDNVYCFEMSEFDNQFINFGYCCTSSEDEEPLISFLGGVEEWVDILFEILCFVFDNGYVEEL